MRPRLLNLNGARGRMRPRRESSGRQRKSWRPVQPHRAATRVMALGHRRDQRHAILIGGGAVSRRRQPGERQNPAAVMSATGTVLVRIFVVGIVVVVVRDEQSTVGFGQRMDNRHFAVERERERRRENGESIRRDKDACRPGSHLFAQSQHLSDRLIRQSQARIKCEGCIGKVLLIRRMRMPVTSTPQVDIA
jgi:hypothetical protein